MTDTADRCPKVSDDRLSRLHRIFSTDLEMRSVIEELQSDRCRIVELEREVERLKADLTDAGMLMRRLCYRLGKLNSPIPLKTQAEDWLMRKGLQGSVLRENETHD